MMKVSCCPSNQLPDEIQNRLNNHSLFTSIGFAKIWQTKGGKAVSWIAEHENKIIALLPGVEFGSRPIVRFMAMPNSCYGSLIFSNVPEEFKSESGKAILDGIIEKKYIKTYLFDYYKTFPENNNFNTEKCQTTLIDISDPEWEPPDKKLRQQIRKGGGSIAPSIFSIKDHFDGFMNLVKKTENRIGIKSKYTSEFFKALAELAKKDNRIWWYWCEHENNPVSSNIFFIEQDNILHWQSYIDEEYSFLQPNKFIPYYAAKKASEMGIKYLNLGASPDNVDGVAFYKSKWGGKPYSYNCLVLKRGVGKIL